MRGLKSSLKLTLCLVPIALTACEGWVPVYTDQIFPYGNERTAGSGVMYVRESMMPAKDLKVEVPEEAAAEEAAVDETVVEEVAPEVEPAPEPDVVHEAFMESQAK